MRILLIDDSSAYQEEFAQLLADSGIHFSALDHASDGAEAGRLMASDAHDIYFVDYRLPANNGLSLIETARKNGVVRPIIVLTGYDRVEVDVAAERAGANDYLPKGEFTPQMLGRAIRYAVRNAASVQTALQAESRFRMAQEAAGIGTWEWDVRNQKVIWSPRTYEIFGLTPPIDASNLYREWLAAVHPEDRDGAQAAATAALAGFAPLKSLFRILRPRREMEPEVRWISCRGEVQRDSAARPIRMVGINVDVTEHQQFLANLRASREAAVTGQRDSEARFQTYFDNSPDCMFHVRVAPDGRFVYETANPTALRVSGLTLEALRGRSPEEMLGPDRGRMMTEGFRQVYASGEPFRYEPTWELPGGTVIYDAVYMPLRNPDNEITGILGIARDITDRRRLEVLLHQAQKMEALGQLAGGVAHDFNNVLTGILGCFELLARPTNGAERIQRLITQGLRATERGRALTGRLLAFSRHQPLSTEPTDINASINDIAEMLTRSLGTGILIARSLSADLWPAIADRNQIELAIMNLAINARDAMPLGGSLRIESHNKVVTASNDVDLEAGDYVAIALADTGSGMSPEVLARVLDPFFTTKEIGKGTGLGLSMVYGVMRQLGGGLKIVSEPGKGTCVTLYLRRAQVDAPALRSLQPPLRRGPVSILLVDDDPSTQAMVAAFAAELRHAVVAVENGDEALAILNSNQVVDIMIADESLPGMAGPELIARAQTCRPGLPTLLVSAKPDRSRAAAPGETPLLAKPFGRDAFNNAVEMAIAASRTAEIIPIRRDEAAGNR